MKTKLNQHTPGPWRHRQAYTKGEPCGIVIDSGRETICETMTNDAVGEANACLIAAAPELLQLLTDVGQWLELGLQHGQINRGTANRDGDLVSQIRAAIAKARGQE